MKQSATLDRELIDEEVNRVLARGSLYAVFVGFSCAPALYALAKAGVTPGLEAPALWSLTGGLYSLLVHLLARRSKIRGWLMWLTVSLFTFFVSALFLASHLLLPGGAATFLTGPPTLLYFFMIAISALTFEPKLSLFTGLLCGIQFFFFFWIGRAELDKLQGADALLLQDLKSPAIQFFKSLMMVFSGAITGYISVTARRLITRAIGEEREKSAISRLFGQFVSDEVKDRIVQEQHGLIGENKELAILFCDLRGFSTFSEGRAPEQIVAELNEYFDRMTECIVSEGGSIDKFIGDAIMAVFGGVRSLPDPAAAAFDAALKMRGILALLNQERMARGAAPLENGIGIHFGQALLGAIGASERKDFTVIGDSVNVASRLEGLCKEFQQRIIVSEAVADRLRPDQRQRLHSLGAAQVKGRSAVIEIYAAGEV
ncbi:MAG: adenylate/guanylate cyclase domain-containing protein [Leptospirales bacterium]|nr:adenylate/guanylate cyclase domain-containing protein [Leptospirales bacterium]